MNKFATAWRGHQSRVFTENGAVTFNTSSNPNVDLFFQIGALRGQPVDRLYALWAKAFGHNPYIATRIMLWARDVRGGAGERKIFRDLLLWLEQNDRDVLSLILVKVPELGRWDDLLVFRTSEFRTLAFGMIEAALRARNGLCAKWMPRKGPDANALRRHFRLTPKQYRKVLVELTDVVEQKMCAGEWSSIDYSKVPSLAQSRYGKSFLKRDEERYREFGEKAKKYAEVKAKVDSGELDRSALDSVERVTINAGAVFPYDVLKTIISGGRSEKFGTAQGAAADAIRAQWLSLPNYVGSKSMLPIVDVSGSMWSPVTSGLRVIDAAVSLGLYLANKNSGPFHNMLMTFSEKPTLVTLRGEDVVSHVQQLDDAPMGYNTNLMLAMAGLLSFARNNRVPQSDMPSYLLVLSDMEFDAFNPGQTAMENIRAQYRTSGYEAPGIVWWNLQSRGSNVPVRHDESGTALVSGFSPAIAKSIMSGEGLSPVDMMLRVIMDERYDIDVAA